MDDPMVPGPERLAQMRTRNANAAFTGDLRLLTQINTEDVSTLLAAVEWLTAELEQARVDCKTAEMQRDDYRTAHKTAVAGRPQLIAQVAAARDDRDDLQAKWAILVERTMVASAVLAPADDAPEVEEHLAPRRAELLRKILDGEAGRDDLCEALLPKLAEQERRHTERVEVQAVRLTGQVARARALAASLREHEADLKRRHDAATRDDQATALLSSAALIGDTARRLEEALSDGRGDLT